MKSALGLLSILLMLFSCKREDVHEKEIQQLSADWDQAFAAVNDLIDQVAEEQYAWEEKQEDIRRLEEPSELMNDTLRFQIDSLVDAYRRQGDALNAISREVEAFAIRFDTQTSEVEELETQLAEGRDVEELSEKVARFRQVVNQLSQQIAGWQQRLSATRDQYRQIYQQYVQLTSQMPES